MGKYLFAFGVILLSACGSQNTGQAEAEVKSELIDIQGHRGCRGLLPENSIAAFEKATELGVTTLEMDVVLSKDGNLIVSHEPWMSHQLCLTPEGDRIGNKLEALKHNIYKMNLQEVRAYTCGAFPHPDYPAQDTLAHAKPTLKEVVYAVRAKASELGRTAPNFNIELKSEKPGDDKFHPVPSTYAREFLKEYFELGIQEISTVQSFDERLLEELHKSYPQLKLIYLSDKKGRSLDKHMEQLSFVPYGFGLKWKLVNDSLVTQCADRNIQLSVWTVNEEADIQAMIDMGARDIISDYPDRAIEIARRNGLTIR